MEFRGDFHLVKKVNRTQVLDFIRRNGPVTKAELASGTKLTFTAVSKIVKELEKADIIKVRGVGKSSGGRKPLLYRLNAEAFYAVGVDLSVDDVKVALMNFDTRFIAEKRWPSPEGKRFEAYIETIERGVEEVARDAGVSHSKILGVGVSAPGPIHTRTGEILYPPNLPGWGIVPLRSELEKALRIQVKVGKDADLSAVGERWFGAGQDTDHLIYVFVGEGIGGGIIIGGSLYQGNVFGAGEIGHVAIDLDGPRCNCGNYGCLEAMASGLAIVRRIKEELRRGEESAYYEDAERLSFSDMLKALQNRDPLTIRVVEEASRILGIGIAGVINAFNPQKVIIGGKLPRTYPKMVEIASAIAGKRVISVLRDKLSIVPAELGEKSAITGAAALIWEKIFTLHLP